MKVLINSRFIAVSTAAIIAITTLPLSAAGLFDKNQKRQPAARENASSGELQRLNRLLGSQVQSSERERVGKLNNLYLDLESGHVLFAVISPNEGSQRVALPPGVIADARGDAVYLKINREKFLSAPKIEGDMGRERASQAAFVHRVYQAFDQSMWWQGSTPADQGQFHNVHSGESLIGMKVVNVQDKPVGQVRNAVIDLKAGRIAYVVMEPASGMDLGNKLYALPPSALTQNKDGERLTTDTDREKLASSPSFPKDQWPSMSDRSFASRVYQHYGKQAYFESGASSGLTPTGR